MNESTQNKLKIFVEFIQLPTSLVTLIPMLIGFLWTYYNYGEFNWINALLFFIPAIIFDMSVTAINTVMDYQKAKDVNFQQNVNVIGKYHLDYNKMVKFVCVAVAIAILISLILVLRTDWMLAVLGSLVFAIGIFYTYGPVPISRTPFGEVASGLAQGLGVFFFAVYITRYQSLFSSIWDNGMVQIHIGWGKILQIILLATPFIALVANIMLANNTRDVDQDVINERYTLVHYIGRSNARFLYQLLSLVPWISWILFIILGWLPWWALITLVLTIPYFKTVKTYSQLVGKPEAFEESIKGFIIFAIGYLLTVLLAIIL